jgi:hypothetical protein
MNGIKQKKLIINKGNYLLTMEKKQFVPGKGMVPAGKAAPVKKGAAPAPKAGGKTAPAAKKAVPPKAPKKK